MKIYSIFVRIGLIGLLFSVLICCKKETPKVTPTVTLSAVTNITSNSATAGGALTSDGGDKVTSRGVCWSSTNVNSTISDSKTSDGTGTGSFTSSVSGLTPGTTYNIRAYASNSVGIAYSSASSFKTLALAPTLTTTDFSAITATSFNSGGNITTDGGSPVTSRGVCWSTNQNPILTDKKTSDGTGTGSFTSSVSGLTPGATYYIRAYATNSIGTSYGNQITTITTALLPALTTTSVSTITSTTATSGGTITNDGGSPVTSRGVCWSTITTPTITNSKTINGTGTGSFSSMITGLTPGTTYYIRAYAANNIGTSYGNQITTITTAILPAITTTSVSATTSMTATSGGNVTSDGGATVIARGVCWSTSTTPGITNSKTTDGTGTGSFSSMITGLTPGTTYYIRAYATNSIGTTYGNELTITTTIVSQVAKIFIGNKPFEFLGAFIPGWYWGQRTDQTDIDLLKSVKQAGFTVLHLMPPIIDIAFGVYDEEKFKELDFFLDQASKQGIRVIIPFIHNISMTQPSYGPFYSPYGIETLIKDADFKNGFILHMQAMANRINTINRIKYSEDQTILGWEIIEEPISGDHNYPLRPPNVSQYEIRQWLDEMAKYLKTFDSNHLVGADFTGAGGGSPEFEDKNQSVFETPSLDFIEIEDGDVNVLQTERSSHIYDLAFKTNKPVIMFISFTGLSYPDPGQSVPNDTRTAEICNDYSWQAKTLYDEFSAYHKKGAAGYSVFSWRSTLMPSPDYDKCFSYTIENQLILGSIQQMSEFLGPLNVPDLGFAEVRIIKNP